MKFKLGKKLNVILNPFLKKWIYVLYLLIFRNSNEYNSIYNKMLNFVRNKL